MCRLLAYATAVDATLADAVEPSTVTAFRELSCLHGDGWGMAWADGGSAGPRVWRSTTSAADDPEFEAAATTVAARAGFLHLRWATTGLAVRPDNTHPFVGDGWAFAHNGFVSGADAIERLLSDRNRRALRGSTDSERYFRLVLQCAERTGEIVEGLQMAAGTIRELCGAVSLNAMLLSADRLLAVHGLSGAAAPIEDMLEVFPTVDQLPLDHHGSYFQLSYRAVGNTLTVTSTGTPRDGWSAQPPDSVLEVDLGSVRWRSHPLLPGSTTRGPVDDVSSTAEARASRQRAPEPTDARMPG